MQKTNINIIKPLIIILGGGIQQTRCINRCKKLGFLTCCFDMNKKCEGANAADYFFQISIKNYDEIESIIASLDNVVAILAPATDIGNITASHIAAKFGLLYNNPEVVSATSNKLLMRKKITSLGLSNPKYFIFNNKFSSDIGLSLKKNNLKFPCIVKPVDSSAGRGISICGNIEELLKGVSYAIKESQESEVIVESIIKGPQFSLETLSFNGKHTVIAIAAQTMDLQEKHVEVGHILPAPISKGTESILVEYALKLLDGFQVKYGASHIEVRISDENIYTLDFASRMGGWRDVMIEIILGEIYINAFIHSHLKKQENKKFPTCYDSFSKPEFCVARMVFHIGDLDLLNDLSKKGRCAYESIDKEILKTKKDKIKHSLSNSAGHYIYKSTLKKESSFVSKYNCVDLTRDFI